MVTGNYTGKAREAGVDRSYIWKFRQNNKKKYTYDATGIFFATRDLAAPEYCSDTGHLSYLLC